MSKINQNLYVIVFFIIFAILFTYPLSFRMNNAIPSFASTDEPYAVVSNMWLVKYCRQNKVDLKKCDFIAYPFGIDLKSNIGSSYLWEFIKNILTFLTNHIFAFNLLILLSFVLSGWLTYLLVYKITGSPPAAVFSGFIFTFSPYHFARAWQHLALSQIQWMPLYILGLIYLKDKPTLKNLLMVAISLFLITSFNFYYAYFMTVATALFIVFLFFKEKNNYKSIVNFCLRFGLACLIVVILILPSLWEVYINRNQFTPEIPLGHNPLHRPFNDLFSQSARPLSYFLPATMHPLFGSFTESFIGTPFYGDSLTEHTLYLGWTALMLAFVAFRKSRLKNRHCPEEDFYIRFFVALAIISWLFSQPPWWRIGSLKIYMPSFFMFKALPMFRAYCRFGIVVMLAVAVLAGFGLKFALERFKNIRTRIALTILFFGLVLFEFWNWPPFKIIDVSYTPQIYSWLKEQNANFVIAEYPLDVDTANEMYKFYQTKHKKKIINGTVPGTYANKVARTISRLSDPQTPKILNWMGVKYILVHREDYIKTELIDEILELEKIPHNPLLKFIKNFEHIDLYEINSQEKIDPVVLLK